MLNRVALSIFMSSAAAAANAQTANAIFDEFRVPARQYSPTANLKFNPVTYAYRTRLKQASRAQANLAGHYVLAVWGCGSSCITGGIVDKASGTTLLLPFSLSTCCWNIMPANWEPIQVRHDSRAIIFNGLLDSNGPTGKRYIYRFDGKSLTLVRTLEDDGSMKEAKGFAPFRGTASSD